MDSDVFFKNWKRNISTGPELLQYLLNITHDADVYVRKARNTILFGIIRVYCEFIWVAPYF